MAAQPSQPPGWPPPGPRLLKGEGEDPYGGGPPSGPPPGGPPPTGGAPGEHETEAADLAASRRRTEKITAGVLIFLGVWVALALFNWGGPPPQGTKEPSGLDFAHVLALLASLFSVGSGVNLLINGSSPPADTKKRQAGEQVAWLMMVLGGLLGVTMLGHPPTALLIPAVISSFLLFTYGLVMLQQKKKN